MPSHVRQQPYGQGKGKGKGSLLQGQKRFTNVGKIKRGLTKPALRKLAFQSQIERTSSSFYVATTNEALTFLKSVVDKALVYTVYDGRKTIMTTDIDKALAVTEPKLTYGDFAKKIHRIVHPKEKEETE